MSWSEERAKELDEETSVYHKIVLAGLGKLLNAKYDREAFNELPFFFFTQVILRGFYNT